MMFRQKTREQGTSDGWEDDVDSMEAFGRRICLRQEANAIYG